MEFHQLVIVNVVNDLWLNRFVFPPLPLFFIVWLVSRKCFHRVLRNPVILLLPLRKTYTKDLMNGPYEGRIEKWSSAWLSPGGNCSWVIPRSTISPVLRSTGSMYLELFEVCARQRKRDVVNKKWWSIGIKVGAVWWRRFANEHVSTETAINFRNVYRICKTDHRN